MANRYFYLTLEGRTQGPLWLGEMRRLWKKGALTPETPVCPEGSQDWDAARIFVEITSDDARMPALAEPVKRERAISLGVWILIFACAVFMWVANYLFAHW